MTSTVKDIPAQAIKNICTKLAFGSVTIEPSAVQGSPYTYVHIWLCDEMGEPGDYPHIIISATEEWEDEPGQPPLMIGIHGKSDEVTAQDNSVTCQFDQLIPGICQVMAQWIRTEVLP